MLSVLMAKRNSDMSSTKYLCTVLMVLVAMVSLASCAKEEAPAPLYSHFVVIDDAQWRSDKEVFFSIPKPEASNDLEYTVTGVLRIGPSCRLKTIPIGVVEEDAMGNINTSMLKCPLQTTRPYSSGYNIKEYEFSLPGAYKFEAAGVHTISFRHLLKDSIAEGIVEVGLIVKPR